MTIIDRTSSTRNITHNRNGYPIISRFGPQRPLEAVNSIVLHQTGFNRGNAVNAYDSVIAHFVVLQNGTILKLRHLEVLLNNAHARASVSIEYVGNFPSDRGTGGRERPTPEQVRAGHYLVHYLHGQLGDRLSHIFAHRQFNPTQKPNCPGPHIWYNVGRWAVNNLRLSSLRSSPGAIPSSWNDSRYAI